MLNQVAVQGIKSILSDTNKLHGWRIPDYVIDYEAGVLASKIDRVPWQPEPSYAERYMQLRTPRDAIELANTCWFTRAVFPELKQRHGISERYYVDMGVACYETVLKHNDWPAVRTLHKHFEFLAETAYTAIRHYGEFRSMWD